MRGAWAIVGALFVVFLLAPIVLLVLFAFTSRTLTNFPLEGLSLRWWGEMVRLRGFGDALRKQELRVRAAAGASGVVGTLAAIGLSLLPRRQAGAAMAVLTLPVMLPPLVLGVALLSFYVTAGVPLGLPTVILSHVLFAQPFVILVVHARMTSFDWRLVESARDLGASPPRAFATVLLPVIAPVVVGAGLLALALSVDDFVITFFTIGTGNTLPTLVWGMIRTGLTPAVNAIGTTILLVTIGSTILALWLTRYRG